MYYFNITCPHGHRHNGFMETDALGYTYVRLPVAGIEGFEKYSRYLCSNEYSNVLQILYRGAPPAIKSLWW